MARPGQVRSGQARSGQISSGQVRSGQARSGQARLCLCASSLTTPWIKLVIAGPPSETSGLVNKEDTFTEGEYLSSIFQFYDF